MSYDELYDLTPRSFNNKMVGWNEMFEFKSQDVWEQTRLLYHATLSPHLKKKESPQKLLPLPWDNKKPKQKPKIASKEEIEKVLERYKISNFKKL